jgi:hypothetical protein
MSYGLKGVHLTLLVAVSLELTSRQAESYSGPEHSQLSDLGLWLAYETTCHTSSSPEPACAAVEGLFLKRCSGRECERVPYLSFGDFTRAGDLFTHSELIVPDPAGCKQKYAVTCPEALFLDCEESLDSCHKAVRTWSENRIVKRKGFSQFWLHIAALHRNKNHFRGFAADQYNNLHRRAVEIARSGHFELALRTEGVALHFLQDLFASGHLASARADLADPAAASIHDKLNQRGLPFRVAPSPLWCEVLNTLEERLGKSADPHFVSDKPLTLDSTDVQYFRQRLGECERKTEAPHGSEYTARGDGNLLDHRDMREDNRIHRTFLVLASAVSVQQVIRASSDEALLQICFQPQSIFPDKSIYADGLPPEVWPPGAVLTQNRYLPLDPVGGTCQPHLSGSLAGYVTDPAGKARYPDLVRVSPRVSVLDISWNPIRWGDAGGGASNNWKIGWAVVSSVPDSEMVKRNGRNELTDQKAKSRTVISIESFVFRLEQYSSHRLLGVGAMFTKQGSFGAEAWNYYLSGEVIGAIYQRDELETGKPRLAARAGIGYGILFFEVGMENLYVVDPPNSRMELRFFAGPNLRFPTSWVFSRLGRSNATNSAH